MNEFIEYTLGPLECESNVFNREHKIRPTLNTHEVMEERRKRDKEGGIVQSWGKWKGTDTNYTGTFC